VQLLSVMRQMLQKAAACAVSCSLLIQPGSAMAEELSIAFPASTNPEIRRAQQTMVESWGASRSANCSYIRQHAQSFRGWGAYSMHAISKWLSSCCNVSLLFVATW